MIEKFGNFFPKIAENVYIAKNALVVGKVIIDDHVSIWPNAVLRGDEGEIVVGSYSNIQDNATVHCDEGGKVEIGEYVTIGHNSVIHGCSIGNNVIIGMGAIVLNGAKIGDNCIIGAGAVILENVEIPSNSLVVGLPAKVKTTLSSEKKELIRKNALIYWELAEKYLGR
ncbi:MAG: gamma carbonic anhydrase family protein [Candidatus Odinarchaeia archaeon]